MPATAAAAPASPENAGRQVAARVVDAMSADLSISHAEAARRLSSQAAKDELADRLARELGSRSAGAYIDRASGALIINVTSQKAARQVRSAGATAVIVSRGMSRLRDIQRRLETASVTGSTLAIDVRSNAVHVTVPTSKSDARTTAFLEMARSYGEAVEVTRPARSVRTTALYGGEAIYAGGIRCSAAFNATSGGAEYVVTAGHCTNAASTWSADEGTIGSTVLSRFPGSDYGVIRDSGGVQTPGQVVYNGGAYEISGYSSPTIGTYVCKTGSTTGTTCGYIEDFPVTVNYPSGTVRDLIQTDVCTQSGDSGGALYNGSNQAVGIVSGGSTGGCGYGFVSFFEDIQEVIRATGLSLE